MCSICLQNPCSSRCPNSSDPMPNKWCVHCGDGINVGDKYFGSDAGPVCKECMEGKSYEEILDIFGESMKTA